RAGADFSSSDLDILLMELDRLQRGMTPAEAGRRQWAQCDQVLVRVQEPPEQLPEDWLLQVRPRGPVPPPERDHPAAS
ncbi:hypothetical protein ABTK42_20150, partial [Acinetobacter baumannii]